MFAELASFHAGLLISTGVLKNATDKICLTLLALCSAGTSRHAGMSPHTLSTLPVPCLVCCLDIHVTNRHHSKILTYSCRCPYYRTAEHGLYGSLTITGVNAGDTTGYADTYWDALPTTTLTNSQCGIDLPNFPNKFKSAFMTDPNNPTCGQYLQFTSQYPGSGPCYPVLIETVDHLNR